MQRPRMVNNRVVKDGEVVAIYTDKENQKRKRIYKKAISRCCMPDCGYSFDLHVHHIFPIYQGGTDDYTNYVVLCGNCHRKSQLHRWTSDRKIQVAVYKFYIERMELGFCSDDMDNEEFEKKLRIYIATKKKAKQD